MRHTLEVSPGDHSIGNLLVDHLMQNDPAGFFAYKVPHPLSSNVEITLDVTDAREVFTHVRQACDTARAQLEAFEAELRMHCETAAHHEPADIPGPKLTVRAGQTVSDASMR